MQNVGWVCITSYNSYIISSQTSLQRSEMRAGHLSIRQDQRFKIFYPKKKRHRALLIQVD